MKKIVLFVPLLLMSSPCFSADLPAKKISGDDVQIPDSNAKNIVGDQEHSVVNMKMVTGNAMLDRVINQQENMVKEPNGSLQKKQTSNDDTIIVKDSDGKSKKIVVGKIKPIDDDNMPQHSFNMGVDSTSSDGRPPPDVNMSVGNIATVDYANISKQLNSDQLKDVDISSDTTKNIPANPSDCTSGDLDKMLSPECLNKINNHKTNSTRQPAQPSYAYQPVQHDIKCNVMIAKIHTIDHFVSKSLRECIGTALGESEGVSGISNIVIEDNDEPTVISCNRSEPDLKPQCHEIQR